MWCLAVTPYAYIAWLVASLRQVSMWIMLTTMPPTTTWTIFKDSAAHVIHSKRPVIWASVSTDAMQMAFRPIQIIFGIKNNRQQSNDKDRAPLKI